MPPCPVARSTSSRIRFLSSALNLRRSGLAGTSGSGELAAKGTAILVSLTMILLAALLCNYGRGKCLIIIGTEGVARALADDFTLKLCKRQQHVERETTHRATAVELLRHGNEADASLVEHLHNAREVQQRTAEPVDLIHHHAINPPGFHVGQQLPQPGPVGVGSREAAIVIAVRQHC